MTFLLPGLLGLLGLSIPVFLAFLHHKKVSTRTAPSLILLRQVHATTTSTRRGARPRHLWALLLYMLALLALVFVAAGPSFSDHPSGTVWIVVDGSASMLAEEEKGKTRWDRALEAIEDEILPSLDWRAKVGVALTTPSRRVILEPGGQGQRVMRALRKWSPQGAGSSPTRTMELVQAHCAQEEGARIVFVTDAAFAWPSNLPGPCPITLQRVASSSGGNLAILTLATREVDALGRHEVYIEVLNTGEKAQNVQIATFIDNKNTRQVFNLQVPAKSRHGETVTLENAAEGTLEARIIGADNPSINALDFDDRKSTRLTSSERVRVLLVSSRPESYMEAALRLHPRVDLTRARPTSIPRARFDLVILEDRPTDAIPKSPRIWALGEAVTRFGVKRYAQVKKPDITMRARDEALFSFVEFDSVEIQKARPISHPHGRVLLATGPKSYVLVIEEKEREVLAFGFHPEDSDLVLRIAFVNLVANIIAWSTPETEEEPLALPERSAARLAQESWLTPQEPPESLKDAEWETSQWWLQELWRVLMCVAALFLLLEAMLPLFRRRGSS